MANYYLRFGNMSKIGNKLIPVSSTISVSINGLEINVKGKEGEMKIVLPTTLSALYENGFITVKRLNEKPETKALHGLFRSLLSNAVIGVETPWEKRMEVVGTGFNVKVQGEDLVFKVGFSHPVVFKKVPKVTYSVIGNNKIILKSVDKQLVGEVAYKVKLVRKPDAYKGKGIKYENEKLRIKPGKKAKTA